MRSLLAWSRPSPEPRNQRRLIFPAYVWAGPYYSTLIYSDNHGRTWRRGGNAGAGGGEMQVAETLDGHLLATIRNNALPEQGVRFFNESPDGGETWGTPYYQTTNQAPLPDPKCQASMLRFTPPSGAVPLSHPMGEGSGVRALLILANAAHPASRTNLTLRLSYNQGRTWPVSDLVYAGSSAYSALTTLATGEVGLLLEMDKYKWICFVGRPVQAMTSDRSSTPN